MTLVSVRMKNQLESKNFYQNLKEKMKVKDLIKNPFNGNVINIEDYLHYYIVMDINPIYPNPLPLLVMSFLTTFYFFGFHWLQILLLPFALATLLRSKYFYYLLFRKGARKIGYDSDMKLISDNKIISLLIEKWAKLK